VSTIEVDSEKQAEFFELIEDIVKSRLLVTSEDKVDLAHEALIEGWKTFREWLLESRAIRKLRDKVEEQFEEWKKSNKNENHLIMGGLLSQVKDEQYYFNLKIELDNEAFSFVNSSIEYEEYQKEERRKILVSKEYSEINTLVALSSAQLSLNDQISSLVTALKASKRVRELEATLDEVNLNVVKALRQVVSTIQERNRFHGHVNQAEDVVFALDYNLVVSSGGDKTVKIWHFSGKLLANLKGHKGWVNSVDIIPKTKNSFLIVSGSSDKSIKIWNITCQLNKEEDSVESVEFEYLRDLKGHKGWILDSAVALNKQLIASAGGDGTVKIWSFSGNLVNTIQVGDINSEAREVWSVSFSADGQMIATSGEDKIVKLWDIKGNLLQELRGHEHRVRTVIFSPDGQLIVSGSDDSTIIFWNHKGDIIRRITDFNGHVNCLRFSRSGFYLGAVSDDQTVKLFDLQGHLLKTFKGHQSRIKSLSFSLDDKTLATASWDKTIRLWSLEQQIHKVIRHHTDRVLDVNFSPDSQHLVTASWDMSACVWDLNGKKLQTLNEHIDKVNGANFSPDGKLIVTVGSSKDRSVKVWSSNGCLKQSLGGHEHYIRDPSFSPDGKFIVTAGGDKTVRVWMFNGDEFIEYATLAGKNGHTSEVRGVSFSPDSQWIISGSKDGYIKLWTPDGTLVNSLKAHEQEIWNVVFSPKCKEDDQILIATASEDKTVKIWNFNQTLENLKPILVLEGHTDRVSDVEFSHCGKLIATGGADKTVKLWSRRGTLLSTLEAHTDRVMAVDFHNDGDFLVSGGVDDTVIIWNIKAQVEMMKLEEKNINYNERELSELDKLTQRGVKWIHDFIENNQQEVQDEERTLLKLFDNI
jgi:WD40 repeat protein